MERASSRREAHTRSSSVSSLRERRSRRRSRMRCVVLHADVGGDQHFFDLLDQLRIDLAFATKEARQPGDEAAPRRGEALLERGDDLRPTGAWARVRGSGEAGEGRSGPAVRSPRRRGPARRPRSRARPLRWAWSAVDGAAGARRRQPWGEAPQVALAGGSFGVLERATRMMATTTATTTSAMINSEPMSPSASRRSAQCRARAKTHGVDARRPAREQNSMSSHIRTGPLRSQRTVRVSAADSRLLSAEILPSMSRDECSICATSASEGISRA